MGVKRGLEAHKSTCKGRAFARDGTEGEEGTQEFNVCFTGLLSDR